MHVRLPVSPSQAVLSKCLNIITQIKPHGAFYGNVDGILMRIAHTLCLKKRH